MELFYSYSMLEINMIYICYYSAFLYQFMISILTKYMSANTNQ